jgi:DNA ligase-1
MNKEKFIKDLKKLKKDKIASILNIEEAKELTKSQLINLIEICLIKFLPKFLLKKTEDKVLRKVNMEPVQDFIEEVTSTNSLLEKKGILTAYSNDKLVEKVLLYTYNTMKQYNITSKTVSKYKTNKKYKEQDFKKYKNNNENWFLLLDDLSDRKITGHNALKSVNEFTNHLTEKDKELFFKILDKSLKIRVSATIINKIFTGLIPKFECVLAKEYDPHHNKLDETWFISQKLDGVRSLIHVEKPSNKITAYSRNGKELHCLEKILKAIPVDKIKESVFLDGEIVYIDPTTGMEDFKKTIQIVRSSKTVKENKDLYFKVFDIIPEAEFYAAEGESLFSDRNDLVKKTFKGNKRINVVEQISYTEEAFAKMQDEVAEKNWEGLMLRKNSPYKGKRIRNLCKVKKFHDAEFKVHNVVFGKMRFINETSGLEEEIDALSAVVIKNKGKDVKVGSGFSLEERKEFYKFPDRIVGKKITVKYFEETEDFSLRFPIFKCVRPDML